MRIGLALSGGGFRATLYHLGMIRHLRDANLLTSVTLSYINSQVESDKLAKMSAKKKSDDKSAKKKAEDALRQEVEKKKAEQKALEEKAAEQKAAEQKAAEQAASSSDATAASPPSTEGAVAAPGQPAAPAPMRSAFSASPARRMVFTGLPPRARRKARWESLLPERPPKAIARGRGPRLITDIISGS